MTPDAAEQYFLAALAAGVEQLMDELQLQATPCSAAAAASPLTGELTRDVHVACGHALLPWRNPRARPRHCQAGVHRVGDVGGLDLGIAAPTRALAPCVGGLDLSNTAPTRARALPH